MSLIIVDTETTGLDPATEQIFEVAAYDLDTDTYATWRIEPYPVTVSSMHEKAVEVNRYFERTAKPSWQWDIEYHNEGGYDYDQVDQVLDDIYCWLDGNHILGAVPDFDARFITSMYKRFGQTPPKWHYHLIDIEAVAVGYMLNAKAWYSLSSNTESRAAEQAIDELLTLPYKSDDLAEWFGVEPASEVDRHTALGDVMWTKRWWEAMNV